MYRKVFLLVALVAALTLNIAAQSPNLQAVAQKINTGGEGRDPLGILESDDADEKTSVVKASIIVNTATIERHAFELINQERARHAQPALTWNDRLVEVARNHSASMAEFQFFSHRGLDDKLVSDRADDCKVGRWRAIGENIAYNRGYKEPIERAVEQWLKSPSHRRNLLDKNWSDSAVGIAIAADGSYYLTQVFMTRR